MPKSTLGLHRFWVLAAAVLLGAVAAGALRSAPAVIPEAFGAPIEIRIAQADTTPKAASAEPAAPAEPSEPKAKGKDRAKGAATFDLDVDDKAGRVRIRAADEEFDSFEKFVEQAPWIAGLVFVVTFLVFLTPILIIALVIFGPKRLPDLGRSLGSGMREFKDSITGKSKGDDDDEPATIAASTDKPDEAVSRQRG